MISECGAAPAANAQKRGERANGEVVLFSPGPQRMQRIFLSVDVAVSRGGSGNMVRNSCITSKSRFYINNYVCERRVCVLSFGQATNVFTYSETIIPREIFGITSVNFLKMGYFQLFNSLLKYTQITNVTLHCQENAIIIQI